ncbi:hypothetical protein DERF_008191 [Dermatophagoides farinae]|uniref:Uncharacterized protein n=1 Tax=Dermatophagoides farinae TaxID=6954 RepID=A0A922I0H5_DERFA|nr:hypothetical protein DERF_008191 [Dermatophagoides farinae]
MFGRVISVGNAGNGKTPLPRTNVVNISVASLQSARAKLIVELLIHQQQSSPASAAQMELRRLQFVEQQLPAVE